MILSDIFNFTLHIFFRSINVLKAIKYAGNTTSVWGLYE
jgi:hypothetical protein